MRERSSLKAGIGYGLGSDNSKGGNIHVNVTGIVKLSNSDILNNLLFKARGQGGNVNIIASTLLVQDGARINADTFGEGKGGNITLYTDKLLVKDGAKVSVDTFGEGKGGNLTVNAQDVQLIGTNEDGRFSSSLSTRTYNSSGDGGNLTLSTNKLFIKDGAQESADTYGEGKGGDSKLVEK